MTVQPSSNSSCFSQLCVIYKLAWGYTLPIIQNIDIDVKQDWTPNAPLGYTARYQTPTSLCVTESARSELTFQPIISLSHYLLIQPVYQHLSVWIWWKTLCWKPWILDKQHPLLIKAASHFVLVIRLVNTTFHRWIHDNCDVDLKEVVFCSLSQAGA